MKQIKFRTRRKGRNLLQICRKQVVILVVGSISACVGLSSCQRVDDPFVDRVTAPVLVLVENATGDGGGMTAEPVVPQKVSGVVTMSVRILELNKDGLLNNKVGIDSIPVTGLALKLTLRNGTAVGDLTTDARGRATLTRSWTELGTTAPKAGSSVLLTWTGTHKGQAFSRLSRIQGVN